MIYKGLVRSLFTGTLISKKKLGGDIVSGTIELRGFMGLVQLFKERNWSIPKKIMIEDGLTGTELIKQLNIPENQVEIIFINGKVFLPSNALLTPGDRVALVPPGTPGPYRVMLGFVKK